MTFMEAYCLALLIAAFAVFVVVVRHKKPVEPVELELPPCACRSIHCDECNAQAEREAEPNEPEGFIVKMGRWLDRAGERR